MLYLHNPPDLLVAFSSMTKSPKLEEGGSTMKINRCSLVALIALSAALLAGVCQTAVAATLCVNPGGTKGCFSTIGAAVAAASPNDTIEVSQGTYKEDVVIGKALSLVGAGRDNTIIDATGLSNGIYIDGLDNPGLSNVVVAGFTVESANFEGILITNASFVVVSDNEVTNNDKSLEPSVPACPGIPAFETAEGFDCGEGIHLLGADHSTVAGNIVENNGGGILLSDDTGATHDNLITGNVSRNNPFDCGIVMASHPPAAIAGSSSPLTVFHNTIAGNESRANGLGVHGAGAGVGIFTFLPGGTVSGNLIINNKLTGNGLPGVAFHAHTPGEFLNDNIIVGNQISGNGADTEDAATPGPTGINIFGVSSISGTVISQNVIKDEADDIVANTPASLDVHLNDLLGKQTGVNNLGAGTVDATENWWGCSGGPGANGCASAAGSGVAFAPWLTKPF
jgi:parallel beta-helix repeat protein